jgi:crotonobetainyl-CoA:carnitine CoA-transferase CaiB-like acyl-CoA transferase
MERGTMRVLELSDQEGAAALAGKLFARWGAEVIKAESAERPPPAPAEDINLNGGKCRVTADSRTEAGRQSIHNLAAHCDILLTDLPAAEVLDLDLLELGSPRSPVVRVAITPFGLSGPYARYPATEATLLALGGHTFLMGDPGRPPLTMPGHYAAYQAGSFAYTAALAALLQARRDRSPAPRRLDVSMLECLVGLHQMTDTMWLANGNVRSRHGNRFVSSPGTILPCKDGWFGMSLVPQFWMPFALMLGRPDLVEGHELSTHTGRLAHRDAFEALVQQTFAEWTKQRVFTEGQETWRVAVGYVATLADCLADRHLAARGFWRPLDGASEAEAGLRVPGSPFRFVGEPPPPERPPRPRGADDGELADLLAQPIPVSEAVTHPCSSVAALARPLEGVRVLDLTRVWAGPLGARILADLGADVIAVEAPTARGPAVVPAGTSTYAAGGEVAEPWNQQPLFNKLHRNRRSLCVDLKTAEGRALFLRLVAVSDVVIENFSARAMPPLDLGYEQLRATNPEIVYVAMPAFGGEGPYRDYVGYGPSLEPMIGLTALMGYSDDEPRITATALVDPIAGVAAATATLTALERRDRTGLGAYVDLSQHEAGLALVGEALIAYQLGGREPRRLGNVHPTVAPHGVYRGQGPDDWITLAARDEHEWRALCAVAGCGWESDPRFADQGSRLVHRDALDAAISEWTAEQDKQAMMRALVAAGVPAGAVLASHEYLREPQLQARGYFADLLHPVTGPQRFDGAPLCVDGERGYEAWRAAPRLGEQNDEVLQLLLGYPRGEVVRLYHAGAIADRPPE